MRQIDNAAIRVETGFTSRKLVIEASTGEQFVVELSFERATSLVEELSTEPPVPAPVPEPEPEPEPEPLAEPVEPQQPAPDTAAITETPAKE